VPVLTSQLFLVYLIVFLTQKTIDYLKGSVNRLDLVFQNCEGIVDLRGSMFNSMVPYILN
jgi:hypothetical protein